MYSRKIVGYHERIDMLVRFHHDTRSRGRLTINYYVQETRPLREIVCSQVIRNEDAL